MNNMGEDVYLYESRTWIKGLQKYEYKMVMKISTSRSLPKVRFPRVLLSTNVEFLIRLHGVRVFDKAACLTHGTAAPYGWAAAVQVVAKASVA
jgi:hypothetical protein